jgi:hypothetical protein
MPLRQRSCGGAAPMSSPKKRIEPESARRSPVTRLKSVVLPAPFGPMMPSSSRLPTSTLRPSMTFSAPNDFSTPASERIALRRSV